MIKFPLERPIYQMIEKRKNMKIIIDKNKCIGCYKCKQVCYTSFEVGSDGKAKVRNGISEGDIEDAKRAEICCPTGAIKIIEDYDNNYNNDDDGNTSILGTLLSFIDKE